MIHILTETGRIYLATKTWNERLQITVFVALETVSKKCHLFFKSFLLIIPCNCYKEHKEF